MNKKGSKLDADFNVNPILNSPYEIPKYHWQLDAEGQPTGVSVSDRRASMHIVPIPAAQQNRRKGALQLAPELDLEETTKENPIVNHIRKLVDSWRAKPQEKWGVTYVTQRLLSQWREGKTIPKPFFCQIEAAETLIWLNEVAPTFKEGRIILEELKEANLEANPELVRFASKMATGSGKTMVMAMMISYHTLNKVRHPTSTRFSKNFLIIAPGITIKDRLRVLLPADPENYYARSGIVPPEFLEDIKRANIVITNYHTLIRREKIKMSSGVKAVIKGNSAKNISNLETEGQMLERSCKELLHSKDVIVINDEAHHCYRRRVMESQEKLTGEDKDEANKNNESARVWISGIEALGRKVNLKSVYDLSATPFFLSGSGYPEGELFPWVVSDFALLDAIESGIVKVPRVPIYDGTMTPDDLPVYRNIYKHVSNSLPKKGRSKQGTMNPEDIPPELLGALKTLYGNYEKTHDKWANVGVPVPPVFIIVCNNTSTSKLIYDFVSGYELKNQPGRWRKGEFPLFSNVGDNNKPLSRMQTLLIDSEQLDSGESMSDEFKAIAAHEIKQFKRERDLRQQSSASGKITDEELLREVMNTVGERGKLGEQVRCVVSVSMLTEGWDTNNVTHVLGIRAFGTALLCEQVVGRALRRYSYDIEEEGPNKGKFKPEYADVFGVPFKFATGSQVAEILPPKPKYRVKAQDDRSHLAITFPRIKSYTVRFPDETLIANFDENSRHTIVPEDAPPKTEQYGIAGEGVIMTLDHLKLHRHNEVVFFLASKTSKLFADEQGNVPPARFRDLVPITRRWLRDYLTCTGGTFEQYLLWDVNAAIVSEKIKRACIPNNPDGEIIIPVVDKFTPEGSSFHVDYFTRKSRRFETSPHKCHVNLAVCDSDWELNFCQFLEDEASVYSYVRNDGLGFEIPYVYSKQAHNYLPDYIALVDDGHGEDNLLNLIVEIKGQRDDKDRVKADTARRQWVPAVNNDGRWGRWAFVEITNMKEAREILADIITNRQNVGAV